MGLDQLRHGGEAKFCLRHDVGSYGRTEALLPVAPNDPARLEPTGVGGQVVVIESYGRVKDIDFAEAQTTQMLAHIVEVPRIRFVGADVLGRVHRIEVDL